MFTARVGVCKLQSTAVSLYWYSELIWHWYLNVCLILLELSQKLHRNYNRLYIYINIYIYIHIYIYIYEQSYFRLAIVKAITLLKLVFFKLFTIYYLIWNIYFFNFRLNKYYKKLACVIIICMYLFCFLIAFLKRHVVHRFIQAKKKIFIKHAVTYYDIFVSFLWLESNCRRDSY